MPAAPAAAARAVDRGAGHGAVEEERLRADADGSGFVPGGDTQIGQELRAGDRRRTRGATRGRRDCCRGRWRPGRGRLARPPAVAYSIQRGSMTTPRRSLMASAVPMMSVRPCRRLFEQALMLEHLAENDASMPLCRALLTARCGRATWRRTAGCRGVVARPARARRRRPCRARDVGPRRIGGNVAAEREQRLLQPEMCVSSRLMMY